MNELLSWGLPITLIGIAVAGAFAALQQNDAGPDEYWIAGGCFVLAGLVAIGRIVLWQATTSRSLPTRVLVTALTLGSVVPFTIEALRYVQRKHARWNQRQLSPEAPAPSVPQPSVGISKPLLPSTPPASETMVAPIEERYKKGRITLDVKPEYLMRFYKEHTKVQADKLMEAFTGKWLPVSGTVANVSTYSKGAATVFLRYNYSVSGEDFYSIIGADFTEQERASHVVTLPKGSSIRVLGKVSRVDSDELYLTECEVIS